MTAKPTGNTTNSDDLSSDELQMKATLTSYLDAEVEELDFNVTSKLSAARHRALAQAASDNTSVNSADSWFSWPTAFGSTAVIALAAVIGFQFIQPGALQNDVPVAQTTAQVPMEDLNILSATDDIEFYQSLEFLEWMASNSG